MKFYKMESNGSVTEIDIQPGEILGSAKGPKTAAQARPGELCWFLSGEFTGEKVVLDYQSYKHSWHKAEWKIDSKTLGVDRWAKLASDRRTLVKETVEMLRYAEQTAFGCICPVGCAMLTIDWDKPTLRLRPGPGFPKTAAKLVAIVGCMDWGVESNIVHKSWQPEVSDAVLALVQLYAGWSWDYVEWDCSTREEAWALLREIRTEIRRYVGDVKAVQLGPPSTTDWQIGAATNGMNVEELMQEQKFVLRTEGANISKGWKPEWDEVMAKEVLGELCMVVGDKAWNQATCIDTVRSAPTYNCIGGVWRMVVTPSTADVHTPRPDPMVALAAMVRG